MRKKKKYRKQNFYPIKRKIEIFFLQIKNTISIIVARKLPVKVLREHFKLFKRRSKKEAKKKKSTTLVLEIAFTVVS